MRKWRPTYEAIYVIPEIKGNAHSLEIILNRIFPLRFSIGQVDKVIFLGDYVDQGEKSCEVLNILLNIQKEYQEQVFFIKGNHDELLLRSLKSKSTFDHWLSVGGDRTLSSYLKKKDLDIKPQSLPHSRLTDFIPEEHIRFLEQSLNYLELDDYLFLHSGLELDKLLKDNSIDDLLFTNNFSKNVKLSIKKKEEINLDKTYIISHNYKAKKPFVYKKCLMLGGNAPQELVIFELNSMSCSIIQSHKSRFYKHNFTAFE